MLQARSTDSIKLKRSTGRTAGSTTQRACLAWRSTRTRSSRLASSRCSPWICRTPPRSSSTKTCATLRSRGVANLEELPVESFETLPTAGGGSFHALLGESVYTASRALLLPSLATTLSGDAPNEHGWLMSVPNRHQVVWHVIKDDTVVPAIQAMTYFTRLGFGDSPGPLSPHVFWCNGSSYEQLTRIDDEG